MTDGQLTRRRRDLVVMVLNLQGFPQRAVADGLDMPRSLVGHVIRKLRSEYEVETGRLAIDASKSELSAWAVSKVRKLRKGRGIKGETTSPIG